MLEKIKTLVNELNKNEIDAVICHDENNGEFYINLKMSESNPHLLYLDGTLKKRTTTSDINLNNDIDLIFDDLSMEFDDMLRYTKKGVNEKWVEFSNKRL